MFQPQPELRSHFDDNLRTAVFAGDEEALWRFAAHLKSCPDCHDREISLVHHLSDTALPADAAASTECAPARASLIRFLEQDRGLTSAALRHLLTCEACRAQLTDAAFATFMNDVHGDDETPAL
jgi:hypothetical protein